MKKQNGITIIALTITIIVILILAGVTIVTLTGDDGLLQKAQTAKGENEEAKELELIKLAVASAKLAGEGKLNTTNLKNELEINLNDNNIDNNLKPISDYWTYKGYKIDNNGNVQKWLTDEYQQVEYIESSGIQYLDTNIPVNASNVIHLIAMPLNVSNYPTYYGTTGSSGFVMLGTESTGNGKLYPNSRNSSIEYFTTVNNKYEMTMSGTNLTIAQWGSIDSTFTIPSATTGTDKIFLFGRNVNGVLTRAGSFKVYAFDIILDGTKLIDLIPCYSTTTVTDVDGIERSKDTIGLYDTVNGQFYVNQGRGTFGYGMEDGTYVAPQ